MAPLTMIVNHGHDGEVTVKPGERIPVTGYYAPSYGIHTAYMVEGRTAPPTQRPGARWILVRRAFSAVPTRNAA